MSKEIIRLLAALLLISITACGYLPVRTPFTISDKNYRKQSIDSDSLRLMVWNIHKEGNLLKWKEEFSEMVKNKGPNIILLQEVRLDNHVGNIISNELKYGWEFSPNTYQAKYDAYSGVLTASYAKPTMVDSALSNGLELFSNTPKTTLFTKYALSLTPSELLVVNIHGINFQINADKFKEQLRFVTEVVRRHDGPVIMAGDFNTWNKDRLNHLNQVVKEMDLTEIDFNSEPTYRETMFGNPLNHIFYKKSHLKVVEGSEYVFEDIESSDHRSLFVEFEVQHQ